MTNLLKYITVMCLKESLKNGITVSIKQYSII